MRAILYLYIIDGTLMLGKKRDLAIKMHSFTMNFIKEL